MRIIPTTYHGARPAHVENRMLIDSEWENIEDKYIAMDYEPEGNSIEDEYIALDYDSRANNIYDFEGAFIDDDIDEF